MHARDWEMIHSRLLSAGLGGEYVSLRSGLGINIVLGAEEELLLQLIRAETAGEFHLLNANELVAGRWRGALEYPSDDVFGSLPDHSYALVLDEWFEAAADRNPAQLNDCRA